ncbi:hypothetical protein pb186bvf_018673 [Paramecium bursaria]
MIKDQNVKQEEPDQFLSNQPTFIQYMRPYIIDYDYYIQLMAYKQENDWLRQQLKPKFLRVLSREELYNEVYRLMEYLMDSLNIKSDEITYSIRKSIPSCQQKKQLKEIYFNIFTRYLKATKTREEMIKFIIRKCMKLKRNSGRFQKENQNEADSFYIQLIENNNQDEKKMNGAFVTRLFQSRLFRDDYSEFLKQYYEVAIQENKQKLNKYVNFIVDVILQDKIDVIIDSQLIARIKLQEISMASRLDKSVSLNCTKSSSFLKSKKRIQCKKAKEIVVDLTKAYLTL